MWVGESRTLSWSPRSLLNVTGWGRSRHPDLVLGQLTQNACSPRRVRLCSQGNKAVGLGSGKAENGGGRSHNNISSIVYHPLGQEPRHTLYLGRACDDLFFSPFGSLHTAELSLENVNHT